MYFIELSSQAKKDRKLLKEAKLDKKARMLLDILAVNPSRIHLRMRNCQGSYGEIFQGC